MSTRLAHVVAGTVLLSMMADASHVGQRPLALPSPAAPRLKLPGVVTQPPVEAPRLDVKPLRSRPKAAAPKLNVPRLPSLDLEDPDTEAPADGELAD